MTRFSLLAGLLLALAVAAVAGEQRVDRIGREAAPAYQDRSAYGSFSSAERNLIRAWLLEADRRAAVKRPPAGSPPGLGQQAARGEALPPGRQNKLVRGERLDYADYSRGRMLPDDLLRQLPPAPPGSEILQIENRVVRLEAATRTILDVFALGGGD